MIIGDNASTDGTQAYLDTLKDSRIRVLKQERNLGIYGNLNAMFRQAAAPLAQLLCADDYFISPTSLGRVVELWKAQPPETGFMRCNWDAQPVRGDGRLNRYSRVVLPPHVDAEHSDIVFFIFGCVAGNLSNVSLRPRHVAECGGFREDLPYTGDFEFWTRAGHRFGFALATESLVYVRRHSGAASNYLNRAGELVRQNAEVAKALFVRLVRKHPAWLLRLHATANYDAKSRDEGLRFLFKRRSSAYLVQVELSARSYDIYCPHWMRWIVFLLSGGGRWGRVWTAAKLLEGAGMTPNHKKIRA